MQNQSIIIAAVKTYRSKLTRYVLTQNPSELDQALSAVRWIKAEMELHGKHYLKLKNGLLTGRFLADSNVCRQQSIKPFVIEPKKVTL